MTRNTRSAQRRHPGTASVELAMVLPVLASLLFGLVEVGSMFSVYLRLHNMAREGVRFAALGSVPEEAIAQAKSAGALDAASVHSTLEYRVYTAGVWSAWTPVGADGSSNNAPTGAQLRLRLAYDYHLVMGRLFRALADDPDTGLKVLTAEVSMSRE